MKITIFGGDLTDISAKKEALVVKYVLDKLKVTTGIDCIWR